MSIPQALPLNVGRWTLDVGRFSFPLLFLLAAPIALAQDLPPTSISPDVPFTQPATPPKRNWIDQTQAQADAKSVGCNECHQGVEPMHSSPQVVLGCTDCHGGNPARGLTIEAAHVPPTNKEFWKTSANPPNSNAWLNHESPEFIRFMNPGDLRVAEQSCGLCHGEIIRHVQHSMMNHGAMLWGAALYNNGGLNKKNYRFGQNYGADGVPLRLVNYTPVTPNDTKLHGILPFLDPLPRFNLGMPGNTLRIFEKGGEKQLLLGNPTVGRAAGQTAAASFRARTRHPQSHRPGFPRPAENAPARSASRLSRLERSPGRLSLEWLLRLPRRLRERSFADELQLVEQIRAPGSELHRRQNDSEERKRSSDYPPVHALDSLQPMHELPHAPGEPLRESVSRLHLVGSGNGWRVYVSDRSRRIPRMRNWCRRRR